MKSFKTCSVCQAETIPTTHRVCKYCLARSKAGGVYEPTEEQIYAKAAELRALRKGAIPEDQALPVEMREYRVQVTDKVILGTRNTKGGW